MYQTYKYPGGSNPLFTVPDNSAVEQEAAAQWPNPTRDAPRLIGDPYKMIVLNWDGTMFPTEYMTERRTHPCGFMKSMRPNRKRYIDYQKSDLPKRIQKDLTALDESVVTLLKTCVDLEIDPVFLTDGPLASFHYCASSYLPSAVAYMKEVEIGCISVRGFNSRQGASSSTSDTASQIRRAISELVKNRAARNKLVNLVCVGQKNEELEAIRKLVESKKTRKTINAVALRVDTENMTPESLSSQIMTIYSHLRDMTSRLEATKHKNKYSLLTMDFSYGSP